MMMRAPKLRSCRAASLVELAAGLVVGLPVLIMLVLVCIEAGHFFTIREKLNVAARSACRQIALAYAKNPNDFPSKTKTDTIIANIYTANKQAGIVENINQFQDPIFETGAAPATVTVIVRYPCDAAGAAA